MKETDQQVLAYAKLPKDSSCLMCQLLVMETVNLADTLPAFATPSPPSLSPGCSQSDPSELQTERTTAPLLPSEPAPDSAKFTRKALHSLAPAYFSKWVSLFRPYAHPHHITLRCCPLHVKVIQLKAFPRYVVRGYQVHQGSPSIYRATVSCRGCTLHRSRAC